MVARRLRPLRPVLHPNGLAQRGTYRTHDGRGGGGSGTAAFAPLKVGPTTSVSTSPKADWPIKQKYGQTLLADLIILTGTLATRIGWA